jgi:hypothetical protein
LAATEGRHSEAMTAFRETVDAYSRMGMRWYRARTLREWADACLSSGDQADGERAIQLLEGALAAFQEMDVSFYAAQVASKLETVEDSA